MAGSEQEAVRTTIVGGRPPGSGRANGAIPRGIEVLTKKAAVDPDFRTLLLRDRGAAAGMIGLELSRSEAAMLAVVPQGQLEAIIAATRVQKKILPAFLGRSAAAMLVALSTLGGCEQTSVRPDPQPDEPMVRPADVAPVPAGVVPAMPPDQPTVEDAVPPVPPVQPPAELDGAISRAVRPDAPPDPPKEADPPKADDEQAEPAEGEAAAEQTLLLEGRKITNLRAFACGGVMVELPVNVPVEGGQAPQPQPAAQPTEAEQAKVAELVGQLGHEEFKVRDNAEKQLVEIGSAAVTALGEAIHNDDPEVRFRARRALETITARQDAHRRRDEPVICFGMRLE